MLLALDKKENRGQREPGELRLGSPLSARPPPWSPEAAFAYPAVVVVVEARLVSSCRSSMPNTRQDGDNTGSVHFDYTALHCIPISSQEA